MCNPQPLRVLEPFRHMSHMQMHQQQQLHTTAHYINANKQFLEVTKGQLPLRRLEQRRGIHLLCAPPTPCTIYTSQLIGKTQNAKYLNINSNERVRCDRPTERLYEKQLACRCRRLGNTELRLESLLCKHFLPLFKIAQHLGSWSSSSTASTQQIQARLQHIVGLAILLIVKYHIFT